LQRTAPRHSSNGPKSKLIRQILAAASVFDKAMIVASDFARRVEMFSERIDYGVGSDAAPIQP